MTTSSYSPPAGDPWPEAANYPPPEVPQPGAGRPGPAPLFPEQPLPPIGPKGPASWSGRLRTLPARAWRGRADDPRWVRPALLALMAATVVLYLWGLGASGWANAFYSAAVQAGSQSWKAFFFGSSDAGNFITVDKPPASLWPMALSVRIFGLSSWSILAPQALMGSATVGVLYATVRRRFSPLGGLLAGAALALTPVATLMFRFNNPDAMLVLLLTLAAYGMVRAVETASTRWLLFTGVMFGFAFLTKTLAAFLILPAFAVIYLVVAPTGFWRRLRQTLLSGLALVLSAGWWVAIVQLLPASDRPYVGGSQDDSFLSLTFGYNGLGRVDGNERGSVGGGGHLPAGLDLPAGATHNRGWGQTGITRLFGSDIGGQIAWLMPAALILLVVGLWATRRYGRPDTARAAFLVWGGWLVSTALIFSFMSGIFHQYYTVALAPAVAALVGMGVDGLWRARHRLPYALLLAGVLAVTAVWAFVLLGRSADFLPWLRWVVLVGGLAAAVGLVAGQHLGGVSGRTGARIASVAGLVGVAAALGGPAAYAVDTVGTAHNGSIITAGPSVKGAFGPGSFGRKGGKGAMGNGRMFGQGGQGGQGGQNGQGGWGGFPGGQGGQNGQGGFPGGSGRGAGGGTAPGGHHERGAGGNGGNGGATGFPGGFPGGQDPEGAGNSGGPGGPGGFGGPGGPGGGMGGLLGGTKVSDEAAALLSQDAGHYTWAAATTGSQNAASYQLATGKPVMALGGFNGTDPSLSLEGFQKYVQQGKVHWFIAGGSHRGFGGGAGGEGGEGDQQTEAAQIEAWVAGHFTARTVGGATFYDLTAPKS
ncbi:glycosyltransferase family 39 protein [Kitasatospora aureofaciens]|uniref:glycosyltransferase family 39 protein n=1 Tax=Kitasatospora aureofaciens TaxID=1894 RepID=UPI000526E105|nr:glycosyltransferase family 39 protein [Kitasatospora aureofaciens]